MSGGINLNPTSLLTNVALGALTGGASLYLSIGAQLMSQVAKAAIQQFGQQLGLPQPMIDVAQGAFDAASGNAAGAASEFAEASAGFQQQIAQFASSLNLNPVQTGEFAGAANGAKEQFQSVADKMMQNFTKEAAEGKDENGDSRAAKRQSQLQAVSGESFLVQLAVALGTAIDNKMEDMLDLAKNIDQKKKDDPSGGTDATLDSAKMQALSQEVSMMSAALTNSIKSIGEALSQIARKG
jgi:hypothetical protein